MKIFVVILDDDVTPGVVLEVPEGYTVKKVHEIPDDSVFAALLRQEAQGWDGPPEWPVIGALLDAVLEAGRELA